MPSFPLPEDEPFNPLSRMVVDDITIYFEVVIEIFTVLLPAETDEFMVGAFKLDVRFKLLTSSILVEFRVVDALEVFVVGEMVVF